MNRNQVHTYLKSVDGLKPMNIREGRGISVKFVPKGWISHSELQINEFHIENWYSITLYVRGIVVEGEIGDMEFHIKYKDIKTFDAYIHEGYKVIKG